MEPQGIAGGIERFASAIFDSSFESINVVRLSDETFIAANQTFADVTGYPLDEIVGRRVSDLNLYFDPDDAAKVAEGVAHGGVEHMALAFRRKDGSRIWGEFTARMLQVDGQACLLVIGRDVTRHREAEESLRRQAARASALAELSGALADAAQDYRKVLDLVVRRTADLVGFGAVILLIREGEQVLDVGAVYHPDTVIAEQIRALWSGRRVSTSAGLAAAVLSQGAVVVDAAAAEAFQDPFVRTGIERLDLESLVAVPLVAGGRPLGILGAGRQRQSGMGAYGPDDLQVLRELADHASQAISNAQLLDQLQRTDEERRRLLSRLVQAQEEERRHLAADLHDDPIQKMTAVSLRLEVLRRSLTDEDQISRLDQLQETVRGTIARLRNLTFELRPAALDREGIVVALTQLVQQMKENGSTVSFEVVDRLVQEPPAEVRANAYRIAQEALSNLSRHSGATTAVVEAWNEDGGIRVSVRDDGLGFTPPPEGGKPGHLGLLAMRERAELAGGWWRVGRPGSGGTAVELWLPFPGR
jgi:PAS domain S-box-containing protein